MQHRYAVTRRLIWGHCVEAMQAGRLDPGRLAAFGRFLLLWNELTSLAVTDGYRIAERDILARDGRGPSRRAAGGPRRCRRRRRKSSPTAARGGATRPEPDRAYRLVAIAPSPESDPTPERPGIGEDDLELLAGRVGHLLGSTAPGAEGVGAGIRLPAVLPLMGRIASSPVTTGPV